LPERKTDVSESWIDPVVDLRGSLDLASGFFATAYADVGSGASDLTWQIYGGIGYRFNDRVLGQIGYRHLSVDWTKPLRGIGALAREVAVHPDVNLWIG
jgi:hypothetical protein